jgi:hypothetical protein
LLEEHFVSEASWSERYKFAEYSSFRKVQKYCSGAHALLAERLAPQHQATMQIFEPCRGWTQSQYIYDSAQSGTPAPAAAATAIEAYHDRKQRPTPRLST